MDEVIKKLKISSARFVRVLGRVMASLVAAIRRGLRTLGRQIRKVWRKGLRSFTKWIDPKLEKYRTKKLVTTSVPTIVANEPPKEQKVAAQNDTRSANENLPTVSIPPRTRADFLKILQQTPREVLDYRARQIITMALKLPETLARDLMLPKEKIVYVRDDETLGPLTLDRLYKSGFEHFPVRNAKEEVIGTVHTTSFNNLEIRETSVVSEILDPGIYYIRQDYTLEQVLAAFLRNNCYFFLVVDRYGRTVGMLTFARLISFLFGDTIADDFSRDNDHLAVAKRS